MGLVYGEENCVGVPGTARYRTLPPRASGIVGGSVRRGSGVPVLRPDACRTRSPFAWRGGWYLLPEAMANGTVELYEPARFHAPGGGSSGLEDIWGGCYDYGYDAS